MDDFTPLILILFVLILLFVGGAARKLAREKGRNTWFWAIFTILFPIALAILVYLPRGSLIFSKPSSDE